MNHHWQKYSKACLLAAVCALGIQSAVFTGSAADITVIPLDPPPQAQEVVSVQAVQQAGAFDINTILAHAADLNVTSKFTDDILEAVSDDGYVSVSTLKQFVQKHNVKAEYIQRFFPDKIVYKDYNSVQYASIDPSLPKNNYNRDNFVHTGSEIQYIEGNVSRALKGIDVSVYQGDIDWNRVKADGVDFAIIRLGYRGYGTGKLVIDEKFLQNIQGATAAGIDVGVYFFTQAVNTEEAKEEARLVLDYISGYDITFPVVVDIEDTPSTKARTANMTRQQNTDVVKAFCKTIQDAGYRPMIYTNAKWYVSRLDMSQLSQYDIWFAQYYQTPFFPYKFQIWQYSGTGRVDGIKGNVDMNLCFVDYAKS